MSELMSISPKSLNRRDFLKISAVSATLFAGSRLLKAKVDPKPITVRDTQTLMGTVINMALVTDDAQSGRLAIEATFAEMQRLIAIFDHRQPTSALFRLNAQGYSVAPPPELTDILAKSVAISDLTSGAFDVSIKPLLDAVRDGQDGVALQHLVDYKSIQVASDKIILQPGMALTLDGIAKGAVVDGAVAVLRELGYENVLVEAGGDLVANGLSADNTDWHIGIRHPRKVDSLMTTLSVSKQAVATSGDYMHAFSADFNQHHIIDPRTGQSPGQTSSVTVLAPNATTTDALSTALLVLGPEAGLTVGERIVDVEALFITKDLQIHKTSGFPV